MQKPPSRWFRLEPEILCRRLLISPSLHLPHSLSIKAGRIARYSVKVLGHGILHPYLLSKTCVALLSDRSVVVCRTASFGFAGDTIPDKTKIDRSRVGGTRFFNA